MLSIEIYKHLGLRQVPCAPHMLSDPLGVGGQASESSRYERVRDKLYLGGRGPSNGHEWLLACRIDRTNDAQRMTNQIPHLLGAQVDRLEVAEIAFIAGFGSEGLEQRQSLIITNLSKELRLQRSPKSGIRRCR